jgi:hypothetical protein
MRRALPLGLLLGALPAVAAEPAAPPVPLDVRVVYVERTVRSEGRGKVRVAGDERSFAVADPSWRAEPGAGGDKRFAACVDALDASVRQLRDPATGRFPEAIDTRLATLAQRAPGGASFAVALHLQRDVDIDPQLAEIDAGSVRLKPVDPAVDVTQGESFRSGAEFETVKPADPQKVRPAGSQLKRQLRMATPSFSRVLSTRMLGSLENTTAAPGTCALDAEGLRALLDDALARL